MQETLTHKSKKILIIFLTVIFICLILISFLLWLSLKSKKKNYFVDSEIYLVYFEKSKKQSNLRELQSFVKNLGGSGEIMKKDDEYFLTLSVYESLQDAEDVLKGIFEISQNAGLVKLKINKLSKNIKSKLSKSDELNNLVLFLGDFTKNIINYQLQYLADNITDKQLVSFLLDKKLNLESYMKYLEILDDEIGKMSLNTINSMLLYINNLFDNFFESSKKNSLVTNLSVNLSLIYVDYINNL